MDPELKSMLTSVLGGGALAIATWGASHGIIPAAEVSDLSNILVSAAFGLGALAVGWYKARQHTPAAQIAAVNNADNGVKVVASTAPGAPVTVPLKGPGS